MKKKAIDFIKENFIIWAFWAVAIVIELTGVCVTCGKFYIRNPLMLFSLLGIFTAVLFSVKSQNGRYWCAFVMMTAIFIVDLVFIVVYDMTGTTFDFSMLQLRGDAMTIIEKVVVNFAFVLVSGILISAYMVLAHYYIPHVPKPQRRLPRPVIAVIMALVVFAHGCVAYFDNYDNDPADLSYLLYSGIEGSYADHGIFGNFADELYKGAFFSKVELGDESEMRNFIYGSTNIPTVYRSTFNSAQGERQIFGAAENFNVVTILAESLEWYSFMAESPYGVENAFPNGFNRSFRDEKTGELTKSPEEIEALLRSIYPNLYELYDTSVTALNHHSREKTDVSENHSIIGNYPTGCLINYDYPDNTIPYSVPNVLAALDENAGTDKALTSRSFHDGNLDFYNRTHHHEKVLGFEKFTAVEEMEEKYPEEFPSAKDAWSKNEHVLDSHMVGCFKEEMFPSDHRFNTYITSITMHGQYDYRKNLAEYYDILIDAGIAQAYFDEKYEEDPELPEEKQRENMYKALVSSDAFIHYAAAAIDFDRAIGEMLDYLKNTVSEVTGKPLIENTLIVMFGDHNAYYQGLGETVRDIYNAKLDRNYTDLFRVPLMIHVGNQDTRVEVTKFTCTTDIVPTIFDLLGILFFDNMNYGSTIFGWQESIIYSRSYNVFITDKLFFTSINNIRYRTPDVTDSDIKTAETKALALLDKTSHINRIFYHDYLSGDRAEEYYENLRSLNKFSLAS